MGFSPEHHTDYPKKLHDHSESWKFWLPEVNGDVEYVASLMKKNGVSADADVEQVRRTIRRYPGETPLARRPVIKHEPVETAVPGHPITIKAKVTSTDPLREVSIHYREMDQTKAWRRVPMTRGADGTYTAQIPGDQVTSRFDMLYYIVARVTGGGAFWPDWQKQAPYIVVRVAAE
jgi:hypothetical protein